MSIKCLASDYVVTEKEGIYYVYNDVYEGTQKMILMASLLGLLIPEVSDYYVPICIEIREMQGNIVITENLDVNGCNDFKYFIAKHQYEKWMKTNFIIKNIILALSLSINIFLVYLFFETNFHFLLGLCVVGMLFLTLGAIFKLEKNNKKRRKYEIRDIVF